MRAEPLPHHLIPGKSVPERIQPEGNLHDDEDVKEVNHGLRITKDDAARRAFTARLIQWCNGVLEAASVPETGR
jgi:hypothetical protein